MSIQGRPDGTEPCHQRWDEVTVICLEKIDHREGFQTGDLLRVVRL
ncbi:uncharacterized protein METZ01_LOCUS96221 [marine metagenome]|uniref:Uncharacterized protein n=1 Tax=marine metagenome TaxID=408172 RepID=A0A381VUS9_9ZZZZ